MSYGTIKTCFWADTKVRAWPDDAKLVAVHLLTCPHRNLIGCFRCPPEYVAADLTWTLDRVSAAYAILIETQFIAFDADRGLVLILNQMQHDPTLRNEKQGKRARDLATDIPRESPLFAPLLARLKAKLDPMGVKLDSLSIPYPDLAPLPSLPSPYPSPSLPSPQKARVEDRKEDAIEEARAETRISVAILDQIKTLVGTGNPHVIGWPASTVTGWRNQGWTQDDILAGVRRSIAGKTPEQLADIRRLTFFEGAIADTARAAGSPTIPPKPQPKPLEYYDRLGR